MNTLKRIPKRYTAQQRKEILEAYRQCQDQLTQRQFVAQRGIGLTSLHRWLNADDDGESPSPVPTFVAVPNLLTPPPTQTRYQFHFPNGMKLEVEAGFALAELTGLLQAVRSL